MEGFLHYEFGVLLHGGAYFRKFTGFSELENKSS